jgi:anti-anti-sigma regulatory factor
MKKASIHIKSQGKNKDKIALVQIEGELVLGNLDTIKKDMLETIKQYNRLHIEVKNVKAMDLTCIQLLCAVKKTLQDFGKYASFQIELPQELTLILNHAGFTQLSTLLAPASNNTSI